MSDGHILVVDDEPDIRTLVKEILEDEGYEVSIAKDAEAARSARRQRRPDLILLDIWMPDTDGITLLKEWSDSSATEVPVVMMSGHGTVETAVEATRLGAYDFIEKPLSMAKLLLTVSHVLEVAQLRRENVDLRRELPSVQEPIGRGPAMTALREQAQRIAAHETSVLLTGESGSGKEVVARYIHAHSPRREGAFVRVPGAALTNANSAVELFGAEDGAQVHYGSLEQANGGTLFLEDVVDMELGVQARLLSALQHRSFVRVEGVEPVSIDVRIIAATAHDAKAAVREGRLREDLYYLLNVVPLQVPALREHREDIPTLVDFYVDLLVGRDNLPYRRYTVGAQNRLRNYPWPGNIRELRNVVQRLLILGDGAEVTEPEVEQTLGAAFPAPESSAAPVNPAFAAPLKEAREDFERAYLEHHIRLAGGSITRVAEQAGIERTHLYRKLRALGVDPKRARADARNG